MVAVVGVRVGRIAFRVCGRAVRGHEWHIAPAAQRVACLQCECDCQEYSQSHTHIVGRQSRNSACVYARVESAGVIHTEESARVRCSYTRPCSFFSCSLGLKGPLPVKLHPRTAANAATVQRRAEIVAPNTTGVLLPGPG